MESEARRKETFDIRVEVYDWAQALAGAIIFVVLLFAFVACMFSVDGHSMEPTLHDGEKLLISNLFYAPAQGDIIMFTKPGLHVLGADPDRDAPLVKRVIAVAGQTVQVDTELGVVLVDGTPIDEPYIMAPAVSRGNWLPDAPMLVPEGHVFVMGDNRNASMDSRETSVGMVDNRYILGRVILRVLPFNVFGKVS